MTRRSQTKPAVLATAGQSAASAVALAAATSTGDAVEQATSAPAAGQIDAHAAELADSVSTSAGGEAASTGAASTDTPSERQQPDPAAPAEEAAAPAEVAAGEDEPELVLGLPAMVEIHTGHVHRAEVFNAARVVLGLGYDDDDQAWAALDEGLRTTAVAIALQAMRASAAAAAEIRALFEPKVIPEGSVEITAKSVDGKPYNRCGVRWGDHFQTEVVDQEAFERLQADPNILVKA